GDRTDDKNADRRKHHHPPPMDISELAVKGSHGSPGEQIGRDHPGEVVEVAEMAADRWQSGGNNRLVERAQEHRQHDAEDDGPYFRMRQRPRLGWRLGLHRSRLGLRFRGGHRAVYISTVMSR